MGNKTLTREEGKWVLSYSLITGPAFLAGTIGAFLGSSKAAAVVAGAHYIGALLNGFLYRGDTVKRKRKGTKIAALPKRDDGGYLEYFTLSITAGFKAMAMILAYLILFMIGINLLETAGVFAFIGNETISSVIKGIFEMTAGSSMIGACNISLELKVVLTSFLVSFGGFSVIGQSVSMAEGSGIGLGDIFKMKLTHGLLAGILAVIGNYLI